MASEEKLDNAYLLLLPEDLLNSVGSWLDDQELCNMELANRELHHALTSPSHPGPGERRLDIGARFDGNRPPSPDASRSLLILIFPTKKRLAGLSEASLYVRCHK